VGEEPADVFLPAPRNLRHDLGRAARALEEGQYAEAVDLLGNLLAAPVTDGADAGEAAGEQDYFLGEATEGGAQTSLKTQAQQLLGGMPEKARELYELKFGAEARQLLTRALEGRDYALLVEVTRRYFHTQAGYEATLLLGRYHLDRGRPLAAALRFARLLESPVASRQFEPELSVLLATCWLMSGMPDRARETLAALAERDPQATLRIGDNQVSLSQDQEEALAGLERLAAAAWLRESQGASQWTVYRGDAARNAESRGGFPLLVARWRVRAAHDPGDEELIQQQREMFRDQGVPALPSLQPLAVGNDILMRTPRRLVAVDLETGKRVWEFPWFEPPEEELGTGEVIRLDLRMPDPYTLELQQRVWDDAPFGQMSSDGDRVFLLWRLAPTWQSAATRVLALGRQVPGGAGTTNRLVALDLRAQGKLQWIVGDEDGTDEPRLAGAFFLGPPLPLMGQLYVLAEVQGEIRLVVLDAVTGQLQWTQQLAHVDQREIMNDPLRRAVGASPSYSDGVLVCPTSAGAVVAVDIATRCLLWGYRYAPQAQINRRGGLSPYPLPLRNVGDRWVDATATIADGRVVVTPVESDQLHCLDLLTGRPLWEPQPRNGLLYTACVVDGTVVLVGADRLQGVHAATGETVWTTLLPQGLPAGRGLRSGEAYYLPSTAGQLWKFDIRSGALATTIETDLPLGNLVAHRDQIISQNVDWLAAYYQTEPLRAAVARRLEAAPQDTWALARRAELLLYDGEHAEALETLRTAHRLAPHDDGIRAALLQALLTALQDDFAGSLPLASELEGLIEQPGQRGEFYRLMAVGLRDAGRTDDALEYFLKLAELDHEQLALDSDVSRHELVRVDGQLRVRRDRWIRVNLSDMLAHVPDTARTRIDALVQGRYAAVIQRRSLTDLRQFVDHFGSHPLGPAAQLELARLLVERNQPLEAEFQLLALQDCGEARWAAEATSLLADLLRQRGRLTEAAACYRQLSARWGDQTLSGGAPARDIAAAGLADAQLQPALAGGAAWPYGKVEVREEARGATPSYQTLLAIDIMHAEGPLPIDASLVFNRQQNAVILRDPLGATQTQIVVGETNRLTPPNVNTPAGTAALAGHLLVVNVGSDILAIDALRDPGAADDERVLWREDISNSVLGAAASQTTTRAVTRPWGPTRHVLSENLRPIGAIGPITSAGFVFQRLQELVCVDPLTGDTIWSRSGLPAGCDVFGDAEYLFVAPPDGNEAFVFRAADGAAVGQRYVGSRQERWMTAGRRVLSCEMVDQHLVMRWRDVEAERDEWQRTFPVDSQCWLPGRDEVAVLERSGQLTILRLADGSVHVSAQLLSQPDLARLYVLRSQAHYVVLVSGSGAGEDANMARYRPWSPLGSDLCPEINGRVYVLDRRTGAPLWKAPAEVSRLCCPLDQPTESPAVVFFQNVQPPSSAATPRPAIQGTVLCMDKRDGRQILFDDQLAMIRAYTITAHPQDHIVSVQTNSKPLALQFTDAPVDPQPPLQYRLDSPASPTMQQVGRIAKGILQVIARPKGAPPAAGADSETPPPDAKPDPPAAAPVPAAEPDRDKGPQPQ
jgi:outer membrane protein assembly factor BamB